MTTDGCVLGAAAFDEGCLGLRRTRQTRQWKMLQRLGRRMCCSENWVRNFNAEIGGGHEWSVDKNQLIPSENFKQINWLREKTHPLPNLMIVSLLVLGTSGLNDQDCRLSEQ